MAQTSNQPQSDQWAIYDQPKYWLGAPIVLALPRDKTIFDNRDEAETACGRYATWRMFEGRLLTVAPYHKPKPVAPCEWHPEQEYADNRKRGSYRSACD